MIMWLSPKLATFIDVLTRAKERWSFGGTGRFLLSAAAETAFSLLLAPIMWFGHTLFLARMPLRRTVGWAAQMRDDHAVPLGLACRALWPHTLVGAGVLVILAMTHPAAIPYALPLAAGLALAIPLAVITAIPAVGAALVRWGIGRLPEETAAPVALDALALPPAVARQRPPGPPAAALTRWRLLEHICALRAASSARSSSITENAGTAPAWTGCMRNSSAPAISCSMPVPMWATASPPSAGSRRGWSQSSRSPRWCARCASSTAATPMSRSSPRHSATSLAWSSSSSMSTIRRSRRRRMISSPPRAAGFQAVQWNRAKIIYDAIVVAGVIAYVAAFLAIASWMYPPKNAEEAIGLRIQAFGTCAFLMLTVILSIGPLTRLDRRFLPLLYNRRHLGVLTFCVVLVHVWFMIDWYLAQNALPNLGNELTDWASYGRFIGFPFKVLGIGALLVMFLMAATSPRLLARLLRAARLEGDAHAGLCRLWARRHARRARRGARQRTRFSSPSC